MPFSVLYIEDDMQQIEIVRMFLAREQVGFIAARDGVSGLAAVREHHPSLVFIDINLPMMNGLEVAATLREDPEFASLPLVALTSTMKFTRHAGGYRQVCTQLHGADQPMKVCAALECVAVC